MPDHLSDKRLEYLWKLAGQPALSMGSLRAACSEALSLLNEVREYRKLLPEVEGVRPRLMNAVEFSEVDCGDCRFDGGHPDVCRNCSACHADNDRHVSYYSARGEEEEETT